MKKICGLTTLPITIKSFMLGNLNYMADNGYKAYVISQPGEILQKEHLGKVQFIPLLIKHGNVSPLEVLKTIWTLYKIFKKERFDIIQYATSNAALYASIAGWMARVPVRIYCQWGISYTDFHGVYLWFYKLMEKITCIFSTSVQPDSPSNLKFSIQEGLYKASKGHVLLNGSATGVDLTKYDCSMKKRWNKDIRDMYSVPQDSFVFGFVGRLVPEKGINELLEAFLSINGEKIYLFLVGPVEKNRLDSVLLTKAKDHPCVIFTGSVPNAAKYHAAFDFLVLPSYREGFGMTVVEAAALATPSIISRINGPTDFVQDEYNGLICEVKSTESLKNKMEQALRLSKDEKEILSQNAYQLVKTKFDSTMFKQEFLKNREYLLLLSKK
ncbi:MULTISPECIES: glycosyltransferase [Bacteroidales]|nr:MULTISPECIES: glycosyltransferase [Bacteroides]MBV3855955.1 glycosyltransferase [Bacteroides thetaiotaomicron]MBV3928569.1 glycosyltransferase [Bacteroides thetaiotaomicron]MBV3933738.1 glycosyltransferase [Bacteroides thetaiotaomicron]MBV3942736.1 glycosyltransferase [Bacteroides thetaiotaomicron]MBV3957091.1 glycosyltransferase [Bacteroides thetaiotaomicron]